MTFSRKEILEDFRVKTKRVRAGNGGSVTEEMCNRSNPVVFTQTRIERSFGNSLAKAPVVFMRRRIKKIQNITGETKKLEVRNDNIATADL